MSGILFFIFASCHPLKTVLMCEVQYSCVRYNCLCRLRHHQLGKKQNLECCFVFVHNTCKAMGKTLFYGQIDLSCRVDRWGIFLFSFYFFFLSPNTQNTIHIHTICLYSSATIKIAVLKSQKF